MGSHCQVGEETGVLVIVTQCHTVSHSVTQCHTVSHSVTQCHTVVGVTVYITGRLELEFGRPKAAPVPPVTSHQSPVTSHQSPVTSHQSPVTMTPYCVLLFLLVASSHARPQAPSPRVLTDYVPAPDCDSIFRRSLPECQQESTAYGNFGDVWGELTVDVSSPVLFISQPKDLIEKRKKKKEEEQSLISV